MVAYSFKKRFIEPIAVGLGERRMHHIHPKRQTIRADRKRHARPGEELQLYCGMRTKGCFLIGRARCTEVENILLQLDDWIIVVGWNRRYPKARLSSIGECDDFARSDGFKHFNEMREFWRVEHPDVKNFRGVIIKWEQLS